MFFLSRILYAAIFLTSIDDEFGNPYQKEAYWKEASNIPVGAMYEFWVQIDLAII